MLVEGAEARHNFLHYVPSADSICATAQALFKIVLKGSCIPFHMYEA